MEISSLCGFNNVVWAPELEDRAASQSREAHSPDVPALSGAVTEDRLELVRSQNLASPAPEQVNLEQALALTQQVREQMTSLDRQEARELYQFDRLRDLCCKVYGDTEG